MTASPDPRQFAAARAGGLLDTLDFQLRRALKTPEDAQVHDLRVAIRRFGQALSVFERSFGAGVVKRIQKELDSVMKLAGKVRDCDVVLPLLGQLEPPPVKIMTKMERRRAKAEVALTEALGEWIDRGEVARWRLKLTPVKPASPQIAADIRAGANRAVLSVADRFFKRGENAWNSKDPGKDLHRLRIGAKKLRYTFELAGTHERHQPGHPPQGDANAGQGAAPKTDAERDQLKDLQSDLGDIHDLGTVRDLLWKHHASKQLLDPIVRKQRKRVREFRKMWKDEFRGREHQNRWMARATALAQTVLDGAVPVRESSIGRGA
jgi:CHAD domain-containing protein